MDANTLFKRLQELGCELQADGDRLRVDAPKGILSDELCEAIRRHKPEIVALLQSREKENVRNLDVWPAESLEAESRFGCPEARLYPFLGKTVQTPQGAGVLWQVLSKERVGVVIENGERRVVYFSLPEIGPPTEKLRGN